MHHSLRVRPPGVNGLALLLLAGSLCAFPALAQSTYPDKPVHIIVPFPPGGPADGLTRIVADKLAVSLGKAFIVDNKPGAGGNIGMEQGAKAAPDGYTLILAPAGNLTIAPSLYSKLPYDPA
ncbi:MAG TPA: tripartite tricarboxylate transporter substrate-binding protein, partial [Casimicrobiaceae bacterium]|nr:tripartite tricarboxylate transporter substrate-binding protein [Casimicrobiaceae bacterium]